MTALAAKSTISASVLPPAWLRPAQGLPGRDTERLNQVAERLATGLSGLLRDSTMESLRFIPGRASSCLPDQVLRSWDGRCIAAAIVDHESRSPLVAGFDHQFVFLLAEVMFGGDGSETSILPARPLTLVERHVAKQLFETLAAALGAAIAPPKRFALEVTLVESRMEYLTTLPRTEPAVALRVGVSAFDRTGSIEILIPQKLVDACWPLAAGKAGPASSSASSAARKIQPDVTAAVVDLRAVIDDSSLTLADIARLRVGSVIPLRATTATRARLEAAGQTLFRVELGRLDDRLGVRIEAAGPPEAACETSTGASFATGAQGL